MTTQVEQTLNVTVAQIEDALLRGETVPDFAREWQEPPANVLAIYRRLQREGRIPVNGPAQVATARAAAPAKPSLAVLRDEARTVVQPRAEFKERATNAVELLARADHIDDRRIKAALGRARKAMTDLAGLVRKYEENSATRARIAELEAELRALRSSNRGGSRRCRSVRPPTRSARRWQRPKTPSAVNGRVQSAVGSARRRLVSAPMNVPAQVPHDR